MAAALDRSAWRRPPPDVSSLPTTHDELFSLLGTLCEADEPEKLRQVAARLLRVMLLHFGAEEGPDGLFEEIRRHRPEAAESLRDRHLEHVGLVRSVQRLRSKAKEPSVAWHELLDARDRFIRALHDHESAETRLLAEAWAVPTRRW